MADDSSQEKTEEPTPKRLQKARDDGQIPRSKELTTTAVLLGGTIGLAVFGGGMVEDLLQIMRTTFSLDREEIFDTSYLFRHFGASFKEAVLGMIPLFSVVAIAAIVGPIALGGWMFSAKSLAPKLSRMNPLSGLKRMFSVKSLVELIKAIGKILVVGVGAYFLLKTLQDPLLGLAEEDLQEAMAHGIQLSLIVAIVLSAITILIAMIDIPFQIYDHTKKLKMTMQEIKDEFKETEGKPEVKSKIRQLQMEMSQRRMMEDVPKADVVITNPTHFSVALKYDPDTMSTPILVAKGVDQMALKIREIAREHNIEFVEAPPLARAIYHTTDIEDEVPEGLFVAVAQVLAYVFQLREFRRGRTAKPNMPRSFNIPDDMQY